MNKRIRMTICANIRDEVQVILQEFGFDDVDVHVQDHNCISQRSVRLDRRETDGGQRIYLSSRCLSLSEGDTGLSSDHDSSDRQCFEILLNERLIDRMMDQKAFITIPGWLAAWRYHLDSWSFDMATAREFFSESVDRIVVLDSGVYKGVRQDAEDFSEHIALPYELIPVGIDHLALLIARMVLTARLNMKIEELADISMRTNKVKADYSAIFDLLSRIGDLDDGDQAIKLILENMDMLLGPEKMAFVSETDDGSLSSVYRGGDPGWVGDIDMPPGESFIQLPSGVGFCLLLEHKGRKLGYVVMDGIPSSAIFDTDIDFMAMVRDVISLAISNVLVMSDLRQSREQIASLSDSLRVTNKVLRHDIANELMIIGSSLELYKMTKRDKDIDRVGMSLGRVERIINQMRELDNLLITSRDLDEIDLRKSIGTVMSSFDLRYGIEGDGTVLADVAIQTVLDNLVRNAIQHGGASRIDFEIGIDDSKVHLGVRDDGKGVPEEYLNKIFKEGMSMGEHKGTGLGLYLVLKTMERYGGTVTASNDPRGGARFDLSFRRSIRARP